MNLRQEIVDQIIKEMENGNTPWQKGWVSNGLAFNPTTNNTYKGINQIILAISASKQGFVDPRWVGFRQADQKKWKIKKGSKGTRIYRWVVLEQDEQATFDEGSEEMQIEGQKQRMILVPHTVFNGEQVEGIPSYEKPTKPFSGIQAVESMLEAYKLEEGLKVKHGGGSAYYSPSRDLIAMPPKDMFKSPSDYYGTLLHEMAHSTLHESRLNREEAAKSKHGTPGYAKEELLAEISSAMLSVELGVPISQWHVKQHAAYLKSWIKVLKDDPNEIFRACSGAHDVVDYLMEYAPVEELTPEQEEKPTKPVARPALKM